MILKTTLSKHWNIGRAVSVLLWIHFTLLSLFLDAVVCGRGRHYVVTSILIEPYLMKSEHYLNHTGNDRYTGYIADLMKELSTTVGIQYRLHVARDGKYGTRRKDGSWDGMIGEIMKGEAGIAAAPIYITQQRKAVVDFTSPFLTVEATVLLAKKQSKVAPEIRTARDLLHQNEIRYGTLNTGITIHAFKNTNNTDYKQMFQNMKDFKPSVFTDTNSEGIERARKGGYAFIIPSMIGEYIAKQAPCDLRTVDRFLMKRHFALSVPKDSYIVPDLNKGLAILKQKQTLVHLYKKWFDRNHCVGSKDIVSSDASYDQHYAGSKAVSAFNQNVSLMALLVVLVFHLSSFVQIR